MKSMKSLTAHLRELQMINDDAFDSWAESGKLEYSGATVLEGYAPVAMLYRLNYVAVYSFLDWHGNAYELFGGVVQWLAAQNYDFDHYGMPAWDCEFTGDDVADIEIRVRFEDAIYRYDTPVGDSIVTTITPDAPDPTVVDAASVCGVGE
jgi:hypothetical protein